MATWICGLDTIEHVGLLMGIPCEHWRDCGIRHGGCCAIGKYGGKPSNGTCAIACLNKPELVSVEPEKVKVRVPTAEERAAAEAARIERFHRAWDYIHRESLTSDGITGDKLSIAWKMLPCGDCRDHFAWMIADEPHPVPFETTVGWHNIVNAKLGKPLVAVEEARKLYTS